MRMLVRAFLSVLLCGPALLAQSEEIQTVSWLSGCWMASSGERTTEEVWLKPAGGLMIGVGRTVQDARATGFEFLLIGSIDGKLTYTAQPSGQPPTGFTATRVEADRVRFENPDHDFPKGIEYERISADAVVARGFADLSGEDSAFEVRFSRVPCEEEDE